MNRDDEIAAWKRDAMRYRFLRAAKPTDDITVETSSLGYPNICHLGGRDLDRHVDRAMKAASRSAEGSR